MDEMRKRVLSLIPDRRGGVKEFAEKIGVPPNLVSMWRNDPNCKSYTRYLDQIAKVYGVSVDWLYGIDGERSSVSAAEDETSDIRRRAHMLLDGVPDDNLEKLMPALEKILGK